MATYTGDYIDDLDVTTPTEGTSYIPELNDAIREIKRALTVTLDVTVKATSFTVLKGQCDGRVFTNEGAGGLVTLTLPTAVAGYRVGFIVQNVNGIKVAPGASDTIRLGASSSATGIQSTTIGATVELECINATEWIATKRGYVDFATL